MLKSRYSVFVLTLLFFITTFFIYHFTDAGSTVYNGPVRLADAILHGRLDITNGENLNYLDWAVYKGKFYVVEPAMTALIVLPVVALFGTSINQTLISTIVGALNAVVVFWLLRGLTNKFSTQVWLTLLFTFGTVYWWTAVNGGIWYFNHTVAVFFLFMAIRETLVGKRPFLAGLLLGASYFSRLPTILSLPFFLIMFSDQWLRNATQISFWKRINFKPLLKFGAGLSIFLGISFVYNYLQFGTPLPASYYYWMKYASVPDGILVNGLFDISYINRHLSVIFDKMPIFRSTQPFALPSWAGMAIWATTPPFLYGLFIGIKLRTTRVLIFDLILIAITIYFFSALKIFAFEISQYLARWIFYFLIVFSLIRNFKNKLVIACWAAIIPISFIHLTYAISGWPQFGYRFALDYYPFLFLLGIKAVGDKIKWHHKVLVILAIVINLVGVLWINKFHWVTW